MHCAQVLRGCFKRAYHHFVVAKQAMQAGSNALQAESALKRVFGLCSPHFTPWRWTESRWARSMM